MPQRPPGEGPQFLAVGQCLLQSLRDLGRIEDQRQKLLKLLGLHPPLEVVLDQRPQCSRGIVDDVPQLLVFAVNVADDMHGPFGKRQNRRQPRDLG